MKIIRKNMSEELETPVFRDEEKVKEEYKKFPTVTYAVRTIRSGVLPDVSNGKISGRVRESAIAIKIGVDIGKIEYRVHCNGEWQDVVTGCDWNDHENGYAGNNKNPIDAIQIKYTSDNNESYKAVFSIRNNGSDALTENIITDDWDESAIYKLIDGIAINICIE